MRLPLQTIVSSHAAKGALTLIVAMVMAVILRPTLVLAPVLLVVGLLYVTCFNPQAPVRKILGSTARVSAPYFALFIVAAAVAIPTAFNAANHLSLIPKILGLQLVVLAFFALGRCIGQVDVRSLLNWIFAIVVVTSALVIVEEYWFPLHTLFVNGGPFTPSFGWMLNRAIVLLSLALMFFLIVGRDIGEPVFVALSSLLLAVFFLVTSSEAAQLIVLMAAVLVFFSVKNIKRAMTAAVVVAIVLMFVGPFLYDALLKFWETTSLADFRKGTIHARLVIWAEYSSLVLHNEFWGKGLNSSKQLIFDKSLYQMPYNFYGWHPHNAGLEIVTDLGWLGAIWLSLVFWQLQRFVRGLDGWFQRGLIAVLLGLLAVSYSTDGLWQSWWWFALAQLGMFIGVLTANRTIADTNDADLTDTAQVRT